MSDSIESEFDSSIFDASDGHKLVELIRKKKGLHVKSQKIFDDVPCRGPSLHIEFRRLDEEKSSSKQQPAQQEENNAPVENEPTVTQPAENKSPSKLKRSNVLPELKNVVLKSPRKLSATTMATSSIINIKSTSSRRRTLREDFERAFLRESRFVPNICSTPVLSDCVKRITQTQKSATSELPASESTILSPFTISSADTPDIVPSTTTNTESLMRSLIEKDKLLNEINLESNVQPENPISNKSPSQTFTVERDIATGRITLTPSKSRQKVEIKKASQAFSSPLKPKQAINRKIVATPEQRKVLLSRLGIDLAAAKYNGSRVEDVPRQSTPKKTSNTIAVVNDNQEPTGTAAEFVEYQQTNSRSNYPVVVNVTLNQAPVPVRETTPSTSVLTTPTKHHYQKTHHSSPDKINTNNLETAPKTPNKEGNHSEELRWNDIITDDESSSETNKRPNRTCLSHKCSDLQTRVHDKSSTPPTKNLSQRSRCERPCIDKSLQHRADQEEKEQQDDMHINTRPSSRRGTYIIHQQNVSPTPLQRRETFTVNRDNPPQTPSQQLESVLNKNESRQNLTRDEEFQTNEQGIEHYQPHQPSPHENVNSDDTAGMKTNSEKSTHQANNMSPSTCHRRTYTKSTNELSKFDGQLEQIRKSIQDTSIDLVSTQTPIIQPPSEFLDCISDTEADLADETSSDRVLLSQSKFKIPAVVGKKKRKKGSKIPKDVEKYLQTTKKISRNNYLNVTKRKLYSKGASDLESVDGESFEVQTTQSPTKISHKSSERAATRDAMIKKQLVVKISRKSFKRANAKNCCRSIADKNISRESRSRQRKPHESFSSSSSDKEYSTDTSKKSTEISKNKYIHENNSKSVKNISQNLKISMQQGKENSKTKNYSRLLIPAESSSDSSWSNYKESKSVAAKKKARKILTTKEDVPETIPIGNLPREVHHRPDHSSLNKSKTNSKVSTNLKSAAARKKRSKIIADQIDIVKNTSNGHLSTVICYRSDHSSSDESEENSKISKSAAGQKKSNKILTAQIGVVEKTSLSLVTRDRSDKSEIIEQSNIPRSQSKSQSSDNILTQTNRSRLTNRNVATTNAMEKEIAVDPPPPTKSRPKKNQKKEKNRELKEGSDVTVHNEQQQESEINEPRRSKRQRREPVAYWACPNSGYTHAYDIVAMLTKGKKPYLPADLFEKGKNKNKKKTKSPSLSESDDNLVANTKVIDSSSSKKNSKNSQQKSKKQKSKQIASNHESEQTQKSDLTKDSNSETQILPTAISSDLSSSVQNEPFPKTTEQNELKASCSKLSSHSSGNRLSSILMPPPNTNVIIKPVRKKKKGNKYQTEHDKSIADVSSEHVNKLFDQLKNSSISVQHCSGLEMVNSSGQVTLDNRCITSNYPSSSSSKRSNRSNMQSLNFHSQQTSQSPIDGCLDSGFSSEDTNLVNPRRDIILDWLMQMIKNGKTPSNNQKGLARYLQTTNNVRVAYADELTFEEIDGVDFAFYDTPGRKFGYLRFKPHTEKKMSCAKRHELHFILLGGTIQMTVDKECFDMKNGDLTTIFIGTRYRMRNITDDPALAMVIKS